MTITSVSYEESIPDLYWDEDYLLLIQFMTAMPNRHTGAELISVVNKQFT